MFTKDSAWPVTITSTTEPAIAITVVCFAQLRPLMCTILPERWFSSTPSNSNNQQSPNRPATFGASGGRPKRRAFGMSLLEDTIGRSGNHSRNTSGNGIVEIVNGSGGHLSSWNGSEDLAEPEKRHPVVIHRERI